MDNTFELRPLRTGDIFRLSKIISKFGIRDIKKVMSTVDFKKEAQGKAQNSDKFRAVGMAVGLELFGIAAERLPECEREIYNFLGSLSGKKPEEIEKQSPAVTVRMIKELIRKEEFKDFFTEASELISAEK